MSGIGKEYMLNNTVRRSTSARRALLAAAAGLPFAHLIAPAAASTYSSESQNYVVYTTFGTQNSSTIFKDDIHTDPIGTGSIAITPGDPSTDRAIILHASGSASGGAAHLAADAQFVRNYHFFANWDAETYTASAHVIMTLNDVIITGPTPVSTSINILLDGTVSAASTLSDSPATSSVSSSSNVSATVFANSTVIGSGFYLQSSSNGTINDPFGSGIFANFTGHNVVTTNAITLPVNTPVTIMFDLSLSCSAGMYNDTGGNALCAANFGNTISFATDRPVFNLPAGYSVNSASAGISGNAIVAPEPASLTLLAAAALLRRRRRAALG